MRPGGQTSKLSLKKAEEEAEKSGLALGGVGEAEALFTFSSLLSNWGDVLEAFSDSSRTPEEKEALASRLLSGAGPAAAASAALLCSLPWSRRADLAWAAEELGKDCLTQGAKRRGAARKVRGDLEFFLKAVKSFPLLERALSDKLSSGGERKSLCEKLLPEGFEEESRAFAEREAESGEGRYSSRLEEDAARITSSLGEAQIEVRSASPLSEGQIRALKGAYAEKLKKPVHLRQIEDPSLVGGFAVRCGSEVTDMSAKSQLRALKSAIEEKMAFCAKI